MPKFSPHHFASRYGFITDYLAEWLRELRKQSFADAIDAHFKLGSSLNQRDSKAVRKTVSGLLKLLHPDGRFTSEDVRDCLEYALRVRRRVKEQLKKLNLLEFQATQFSYLDAATLEEHFISLPEQTGGGLVSDDPLPCGQVYALSRSGTDRLGAYRIEVQVVPGTGRLIRSGAARDSAASDSVTVAFNYFRAHAHRISSAISVDSRDYQVSISDLQGVGAPQGVALALLIALFGASLERCLASQFAVLGDMTLGGTISPVERLAASLQVGFDAGVKRVLLPMVSAGELVGVPPELFSKFQTAFYADPVDAVFKALI